MSKVYNELASLCQAMINCEKSNNQEWYGKHSEKIGKIIKEYLPHGSGIDSGYTFDIERSTGQRLVIHSSFHVMDENGFYDGWINYDIIIEPCLIFGFTIAIRGKFTKRTNCIKKDCRDVKEYLYDILNYSFNQEVE